MFLRSFIKSEKKPNHPLTLAVFFLIHEQFLYNIYGWFSYLTFGAFYTQQKGRKNDEINISRFLIYQIFFFLNFDINYIYIFVYLSNMVSSGFCNLIFFRLGFKSKRKMWKMYLQLMKLWLEFCIWKTVKNKKKVMVRLSWITSTMVF